MGTTAARPEPLEDAAVIRDALAAFAADAATQPALTLRAGNALDEYREPPPFDPAVDVMSDAYLEQNLWGIAHIDPGSWRHVMPALIDYALRHRREGSEVTDALLLSLRPPDRQPPRLGSLSPAQESVIRRFLERLAFADDSPDQAIACQVLEEWWIPGALYRPRA